jgi:histidinol phosphatase-like PHP family hydrolase
MPGLLTADYHTHSCFSDGGAQPESTPMSLVEAAQAAGLEALGITDHVNSPADWPLPGLVRQQVPTCYQGVRVYVGCEAEMHAPDELTIGPELAAELDYVIVSASHLYNPGVRLPPDLDAPRMAAYILELMNGAIASGLADIISHPFGVPWSEIKFPELAEAVDRDDLMRTAESAASRGVAFELNPAFVTWVPDLAGWLFSRFLEAGAKLSIGSDAHVPGPVGCRGSEFATEEQLRAIGMTEDRLWHPSDRISHKRR